MVMFEVVVVGIVVIDVVAEVNGLDLLVIGDDDIVSVDVMLVDGLVVCEVIVKELVV